MYGSAYLNRPPVVSRQALSSREMNRVSHDTTKNGDTLSSFSYNGRVALALIPSLIVLVGYGGPLVAGVLLVC